MDLSGPGIDVKLIERKKERCACVDFGCAHSIEGGGGVILKSTHLLVGFLLKI